MGLLCDDNLTKSKSLILFKNYRTSIRWNRGDDYGVDDGVDVDSSYDDEANGEEESDEESDYNIGAPGYSSE